MLSLKKKNLNSKDLVILFADHGKLRNTFLIKMSHTLLTNDDSVVSVIFSV